ncbi:MAG: hydroxyacid dehydrogenase [Kiritimatiellales bacterium]
MKKAVFFYNSNLEGRVYGPKEIAELCELVNLADVRLDLNNWKEHLDVLKNAEILMSSWGAPVFDEEFLAAAPKLEAVFYGAGSIKALMTNAAWDRGLRITSAYAANAVPVAEYTLSMILFCLKHGWRMIREARDPAVWLQDKVFPGTYQSKIGIISLGMIGKKTCELLKPFDLEVFASSSYGSPKLERELGVRFVSMEEIFKTCDVVSLHTPLLPHTRGLITGDHLRFMKQGASFINTARGAVVREQELIDVMKERPDLTAVLDVTDPEPPAPDSPLFELPNVIVTPHLAGSFHYECRRLGHYMVDELRRFLNGEDLLWEITRDNAGALA